MGLIGGAISVGVGSAVKSFAGFEQQINSLGAVTGAAGEQLTQLSDLALQLGQDTAFGASEAATALTELAKAGVPIEDILAGAGRAAVDLATATGTDLTQSANALANAMSLFAETGIEAADAVDILTAAANESSADLGDLQAGLRNLGPVVAGLGGDLQDAAAAVAYFTKFGLKAADVGVSLARALDRVAAPGEDAATAMRDLGIAAFDVNGEFVGFPALFDNIHDAMADMSDEARTAATALIFGAEAQDVVNIAIREGATGYEALRAAIEPAGQAAAASEARMAGLSGALEQMQGSIENAAIAFGASLAPAIEAAAGGIERAADAFGGLSQSTQQIAAISIAAAGGLALMAAALAKTVMFAVDAAAALARLRTAIVASRLAMGALSVAFNPVTLAIAGLALAAGLIIREHRAQQAAARALAQAYRELGDAINAAKLRHDIVGVQALGKAQQQLIQVRLAVEGIEAAFKQLMTQARGFNETIPDPAAMGVFGHAAKGATIEIQGLLDRLQEAKLSEEELAEVTELATQALTTQGIDVARVSGIINQALSTYAADIRSKRASADAGERLIQTFVDLVANIGDYAAVTEEATEAQKQLDRGLGQIKQTAGGIEPMFQGAITSWAEIEADEAEKAAQALKDAFAPQELDISGLKRAEQEAAAAVRDLVDETVDGTRAMIAGFQDLPPELDAVADLMSRTGDSAATMVTKLAEAGAIDLSPAEHEALQLQRTLEDTEANIESVTSAIANNQEDLSMWAGRIDLVTDVLGGNTEKLDKWLKKLQEGEITQEEFNAAVSDPSFTDSFDKLDALYEAGELSLTRYNKAKQAGIHLLQRSAGGIQDENEELVANLIALDAYVIAHDNAHGAVKDLTDEQRGFLAALQSTEGQMALQTIQLAAYLALLGVIPASKVTEIAVDLGQADPMVNALLDDLGLLGEPVATNYTLTGDGSEQVGDLHAAITDIPAEKDVAVNVSVTGDGTDIGASLQGPEQAIAVPTALAAPDDSAVTGYTPPTISIPTKLEAPDESAVTGYAPAEPVLIPARFDTPTTQNLTEIAPPTVLIPTQYTAPKWPEGAALQGPDPVTLPTVYGAPDETAITNLVPPTVAIATELDASGAETDLTDLDLTATAKIGASDTVFAEVLRRVRAGADNFADDTFEASIAADPTDFDRDLDAAIIRGIAFAGASYEASVNADAGDALEDIQAAYSLALAFERTYTATIQANIQPALTSLQTLADNLPSSPAKKGPLSKEPDFDYVVQAFVDAMDEIKRLGDGAATDFGATVTASLREPTTGSLARSAMSPAAMAGGGGYVDARQFYALRTDEYARLLADAEMGAGAHDWISRRERAFATVGG